MKYLIDTCVLIDHLTGRLAAKVSNWLEKIILSGAAVSSVIVYHELLTGARTPKAQKIVKTLLENWELIPVDSTIAEFAATLRREWAAEGKTMSMADSLIAATAAIKGVKVITSNLKDFPPSLTLSLEKAIQISAPEI
ncbi:Ribonuclease VapC10 [Moorella humiferrea]|uniref:PIN domain-containing protein n=1 Tax=Neomoorella humiferrea TaxID=676965 RepID=UPI0030CAA151